MTSTITPDTPGAAGILFRVRNLILLVFRSADAGDHPLTWGLPAGKIEPGESAEQAALRESMEEIGSAPASGLPILDAEAGFTTFLATGLETFQPVLNAEHLGYVWAPIDALPAPLHPGVEATVARRLVDLTMAMDGALVDGNGWRMFPRTPLSKVGIFPYSGKQLGLTGADASRMFRVYRPAEELGHPECAASVKLLPFVDDHTMIGPVAQDALGETAQSAEQKGVDGVVGEDVYFDPNDGDGVLYGNPKVFSDKLASLISAGKRELSLGYQCRYDMTPGVWKGQAYDAVQRNIRGNHLALVKQGRMGSDVALAVDHLSFSLDALEHDMADDKTTGKDEAPKDMTLSEIAALLKQVMPQLAAIQAATSAPAAAAAGATDTNAPAAAPAAQPAVPAVTEDNKQFAAAMDAALKPYAEQLKTLQGQMANSEAAFMQRMTQRNALATKLGAVFGSFDHAEMNLEAVAKYGCEKFGLKDVPAGQEVMAVNVALAARGDAGRPAALVAMDDADTSGASGDAGVAAIDSWLSGKAA